MRVSRFAVLAGSLAGFLAATLAPVAASAHPASHRPPPDALHAPVAVAHTRDGEVGYRSIGRGSPIVLITGLGASIDAWSPTFLDDLARDHRVIVFDNAGVGDTTPLEPLTADAMADQTAAFLHALHLNRPTVFGWSMGGMIAQDLAIRHPRTVGRLVLAATQSGDGRAAPVPPAAAAALDSGDPAKILSVLFPADQAAAEQAYGKAILAYPGFYLAPKDVTSQQDVLVRDWIAGDTPTGHRARLIHAPALVLDGDSDALDPAGNAALLAHDLPPAASVLYPDAGHAFMDQDPARVSRLVARFAGRR